MLKVGFNQDAPLRVLCLGSHCDDIEIGCGGTILDLARQYPQMSCHWVVFSSTPQRAPEAAQSAELFLEGVAEKQVAILDFRDGFFPSLNVQIKEYFEQLKQDFAPDLIFTHYRSDLHQDHRVICDLTWNTFRNHMILEYEILKYDGDLGTPNLFVHLDDAICRRKVRVLLDCFQTQASKHWFTEDTFMALMRIRGVESASPTRFAEAFYSRKIVLGG